MLKKILSCIVMVSLFALTLSLAGCSGQSIPDYYNTTYTLTGKALDVEWDRENAYDNGYKQLSASGENYSYRYLIEQYFDEIEWGDDKPADVNEVISRLDKSLMDGYKDVKGLSFAISSKENLTLTITYPDDMNIQPMVIKMAENIEDFRAIYPNELRYPSGYYESPPEDRFYENSAGRLCIGVFEYAGEDGNTYDKLISFSTDSPYGLNHKTLGDVIGIICDVPMINSITGSYQFDDMYDSIELWSKEINGSASTLVTITVRPEITVTSTK